MPVSQTNSQRDIRKAAILVSALDRDSADALLDRMGPQQASLVRSAVMELGEVPIDVQHRVIKEFLGAGAATTGAWNDGIEISDSLARRLSTRGDRPTPRAEDGPSDEAPPFRFLHEAGSESLGAFLRDEHPQTIAVVVSHLPPECAGDLITRFPPSLQTEVLRRVADLDEMNPEMVRDIERELESLLTEEIRTTRRRSAGLRAVNAILAAVDSRDREDVLGNLADHDEAFASKLRQDVRQAADESETAPTSRPTSRFNRRAVGTTVNRARQIPTTPQPDAVASRRSTSDDDPKRNPTVDPPGAPEGARRQPPDRATENTPQGDFHDLVHLIDRDVATLFRAANPQLTLLALTGAQREFADRVLKQLSPRDAKSLRQKMEQLSPLRLRDVEHAQQQLARLAGQLASRGSISLPAVRRFAVAA